MAHADNKAFIKRGADIIVDCDNWREDAAGFADRDKIDDHVCAQRHLPCRLLPLEHGHAGADGSWEMTVKLITASKVLPCDLSAWA